MILVTGATGRLGTAVLQLLETTNRAAVGVGGPASHSNNRAKFSADLADAVAVDDLFARLRPSAVIHAAAWTDVDGCEADPSRARAANAKAVECVARACLAYQAKLEVVSTDGVFDGRRGNYTEMDKPNPINKYAATKLAGERAALDFSSDTIVARTNFVGSSVTDRPGLAEWVLARLERGDNVPGFVDAEFSPLHSELLAQLLVGMLDARLKGVYHVGSHDSVTKYDFSRRLAEWVGYDPSRIKPSCLAEAHFAAPRPAKLGLNVSRIEADLGRRMPMVQEVIEKFPRKSQRSK
jgi:dTDP-4-dehydrorhamnose reductase